jgi:hypothetical protein
MSPNVISLPRPARVVVNRDAITVDRAVFCSMLDLTSGLIAERRQFARDDLLVTVAHLCSLLSDLIEERRGP